VDELEHARRENMALQEMLAHVLSQVGETVYINKEDMQGGKFEGKRINIELNAAADRFELSLVDV
jgi:hypothetical protein